MSGLVRELRALAADARQCADEAGEITRSGLTPVITQLTFLGFAARLDEAADRAEAVDAPRADWTPGRLAKWLWP